MIKVNDAELERMEVDYPGIRDDLSRYEARDLPPCPHCGSTDIASVGVGMSGRTIHLSWATTTYKLISDGPKQGAYWCNTCARFSGEVDGGDEAGRKDL